MGRYRKYKLEANLRFQLPGDLGLIINLRKRGDLLESGPEAVVDMDNAGRGVGFVFPDQDAGDGPALHQPQDLGGRGVALYRHRVLA